MSYATKPWDDNKMGVDRINAIREYILSDKSSYERASSSGTRMIWNGATEKEHNGAQPEGAGSQPGPGPSDPEPTPASASERRNKALSIIMQHLIDPISNEVSRQFFASD
jgi:hypothetical protein